MASESVATSTPGIVDLLINTMGHIDNPERIAKATDNVLETVTTGLTSIGRLLWLSRQSEDWTDTEDDRAMIGDAGCLIALLAEMSNWLRTMNSNAHHDLQQAAAKKEA